MCSIAGIDLFTGYTWTFAAQCIICCFGVIPVYLLLQRYGPRLRRPMYIKRFEDLEGPTVDVTAVDETKM